MEVSSQSDAPLGLSLDFMFGRGYLRCDRRRIADWIGVESLRMEIPDLEFPFETDGGLGRFRHTRCLVREVEMSVSEVKFAELIEEATGELEDFDGIDVRFLEDAICIGFRFRRFDTNPWISFRMSAITPEPSRADEIHLSVYDYRAYGAVPCPTRVIVHELITKILDSPAFQSAGVGPAFTVGVAGDILRLRPLKLLFLNLFAPAGWKLPNLSGIALRQIRIRPGKATLRAVDETDEATDDTDDEPRDLTATKEGAKALAAYEAKELFAPADQALFERRFDEALSLLENYRDVYGLHPALVKRLLESLVADGATEQLAEAESICRRVRDENPDDLSPRLIEPLVALARRRHQAAVEAFASLSEELREREEFFDWTLCELAIADLLADDEPERAAEHLREILERSPRFRPALEALHELYDRVDDRAGFEETLKRLAGVYTERDKLEKTYLELAQHLIAQREDLGEARMYLEKVLRLDDDNLQALCALGDSYALGEQWLRSLKAYGSAARTALADERPGVAAGLHGRIADIWLRRLDEPHQALLEYRRALSVANNVDDLGARGLDEDDESLWIIGEDSHYGHSAGEPLGGLPAARASWLEGAARACELLSRDDEAIRYWNDALSAWEKLIDEADRAPEDDPDSPSALSALENRLAETHRRLGRLYDGRDRTETADRHFRRLLELKPDDQEANRYFDPSASEEDPAEGPDDEELESFRRRFEEAMDKPPELPDAPSEPVAEEDDGDELPPEPETLRMSTAKIQQLQEDSSPEELGPPPQTIEDTSPAIHPVQMAKNAISEARESGDKRRLADALEDALTLDESTDSELLDDDERIKLSREVGELLYYELEEDRAARPHFERLRQLDPDGEGADPAVVNALESIYEATGAVEPRIELLEHRLQTADSDQMKSTYRLLVARTIWGELGDADRARRHLLDEIERGESKKPAHRLLAEIARETGDFAAAADHLERALEIDDEGIEAVETRFELAELAMERLDDPQRAARHYEKVLAAAPGNSRALQGLCDARRYLEDWPGVLECLGRELALLIGETGELSPEEMVELDAADIDDAVEIPASRIVADAADIADAQLKQRPLAHRLWGISRRIWPRHVEALEQRISVGRACGKYAALAADLEDYAGEVLDPLDAFEALVEAAKLRAEQLDEPDRAAQLYARALDLVDDLDDPPEGLEEIRRAAQRVGPPPN